MSLPEATNTVSLTAVERLRAAVEGLFNIQDTTLDYPEAGFVRFRGQFIRPAEDCFDEICVRFYPIGFTPKLKDDNGRIELIAFPGVYRDKPANRMINLALFIATIFSTLFVGASYAAETVEQSLQLWRGWPFSLSIMLILTAHELGHYFAARYHKVPVSEPYFIPMPLSIIGTMGAFIQLKAPVRNRRALLDVGASGPLAGMLFAVPVLIIGLLTSEVGALPTGPYVLEGNSLFYLFMKYVIYGQILPAGGLDVQLNQVAWAGWVGLLITGLNLIPVGQLDGGHIAYVLFGERARLLFWPMIAAMAVLVVLTGAYTWVFWIGLLLLFGRRYAEPLDNVTGLDKRRKAIAIFTFCLFFLVFVPIPLVQVGL